MAQAVEVHVRAAHDRREPAAVHALTFDVPLQSGHGERTGRFGDRAGVLEDVPDRCTDLIGGDKHDLVDAFARNPEGLLPHLLDRHAIGKDPNALQDHPLAGREGRMQRWRIMRLDTDDTCLRP